MQPVVSQGPSGVTGAASGYLAALVVQKVEGGAGDPGAPSADAQVLDQSR